MKDVINILIASGSVSQGIQNDFEKAFGEQGISIKSIHVRTSYELIREFLSSNKDIDLIIVSEYLGEMVMPAQLDQISLAAPNAVLIPIVHADERGGDYLRQLEQAGIYTAVFENDAQYETIVSLAVNGRTKGAARDYYGIERASYVESGESIDQYVRFITQANVVSLDNMRDVMDRVNRAVANKSVLLQILERIPQKDFDFVRRIEEYRVLCDIVEESRAGSKGQTDESVEPADNGGAAASESAVEKKEKRFFKKSPKESKKAVKKKKEKTAELSRNHQMLSVGIASMGEGYGATTTAIMFAHVLARKYKDWEIAVIDMDEEDGMDSFSSLCQVATGERNLSGLRSFQIEGRDNLTYFMGMPMSEFNRKHKAGFDVVVYDFGCCSDDVIQRFLLPMDVKCIIGSTKEWKLAGVSEYISEVSKLDTSDDFNWLFPCADDELDMAMIDNYVSSGAYRAAIPTEPNPFSPSKETEKLFLSLMNGRKKEKRYKDLYEVSKKAVMKPYVAKWKKALAGMLFIGAFALMYGAYTEYDNAVKYKILQNRANAVVSEMESQIDVLTRDKIECSQELKDLEREVLIIKRDVAPGEKITKDLVEHAVIHSETGQDEFVTEDGLGDIAASVSMKSGTPLMVMCVGAYREDVPDIPEELEDVQVLE